MSQTEEPLDNRGSVGTKGAESVAAVVSTRLKVLGAMNRFQMSLI